MAASVLITGGAGFIGCSLARRLVDRGLRVTVLDVLHRQVHGVGGRPEALPVEVRLIAGDVTSAARWTDALTVARPDTVVHLAAETGTSQSLYPASTHGRVNVLGTTQLMDSLYATAQRPEHIVLASSRAVYGEGAWRDADSHVFYPGPRLHDDLVRGRWNPAGPTGHPAIFVPHRAATTIPQPASVYAATKLAQEHLLTSWAAATGVGVSVLRLQNVYGPGQSLINDYTGVLAHFARLAVEGEAIDVYEDGEIVRDFTFVDDATAALEAAVLAPPSRSRVLDIGLGRSTTILEVARSIATLAGAPPPRVSGRFRDGDVRAAGCDIADAEIELGYRPAWPLARGLVELVEWVMSTYEPGALADVVSSASPMGPR